MSKRRLSPFAKLLRAEKKGTGTRFDDEEVKQLVFDLHQLYLDDLESRATAAPETEDEE